jgi:hypothetical protein
VSDAAQAGLRSAARRCQSWGEAPLIDHFFLISFFFVSNFGMGIATETSKSMRKHRGSHIPSLLSSNVCHHYPVRWCRRPHSTPKKKKNENKKMESTASNMNQTARSQRIRRRRFTAIDAAYLFRLSARGSVPRL